jgi:hypothetical protein
MNVWAVEHIGADPSEVQLVHIHATKAGAQAFIDASVTSGINSALWFEITEWVVSEP